MAAKSHTSSFVALLKPDTASLGYALFLAINAASIWGGVFPFMPMEFQTGQILFAFFLAQSLAFTATFFASVVGVYFFPKPTSRFMAWAAGVPYFLGWCALIAAIYLGVYAVVLVEVGGVLLGVGTAGFYMLWQRLFASRDADQGNRELIVGTAYGALFYFALYLIPNAVTVFLIPTVFMPLFALSIVLQSRTIERDQPMFQDKPREHPKVYGHLIRDYWRGALAIGAIGFSSGIMRALAIAEPSVGSIVNIMSMAASFAIAVALLIIWRNRNLRINIATAFRAFFPFLVTGFVILPLAADPYATVLASLIYAVYSCAIVLMMIQCAQASRDNGIKSVQSNAPDATVADETA